MAKKEKAVTVSGSFYDGYKSKGKKEKAIMPLKGKSKIFKREKAIYI